MTAETIEDTRYHGWWRPATFEIVSVAKCRGCGGAIAWALTPSGRSAPLDRDGGSHFATCPDAERFRRRRGVR